MSESGDRIYSRTANDRAGGPYRLGRELGRGGQGVVWSLDEIPELAAKLYHQPPTDVEAAKLVAMCRIQSNALLRVAAWPVALAGSRMGRVDGLLMRRVSGHAVHQLYGLKSRLRLFPEVQFPFLLHAGINIARAFATVHAAGQVIGDVNHSNLLVAQDATVALIDCDSFQIAEDGRVYPCTVGVPEFTPPELYGQSFGTQVRTAEHDAFGLAVLLFSLLFLGRHPFMGLYDPRRDEMLPLEQAIVSGRFPYALPPESPDVRLPPFAPRLSEMPPEIRELFTRAFAADAPQRGRPPATQWVEALTGFLGALRICESNANHHYYQELKHCPWCRVEGLIGTAVFGMKVLALRDESFPLEAIWAQIEAITPTAEPMVAPDVAALRVLYSPEKRIVAAVTGRRNLRLGAVAAGAIAIGAAYLLLPLQMAAIVALVAVIVVGLVWSRGAGKLDSSVEASYEAAAAAYEEARQRLQNLTAGPVDFLNERDRLLAAKAEYEGLQRERAGRMAGLTAARERHQLQRFLEQFRIEDLPVRGLHPQDRVVLKAWHVEDAFDIDPARLKRMGFSPVKQQAILNWRRAKEEQFVFDATVGIDQRDLRMVEQELVQKSTALKAKLTVGPERLHAALMTWQAQRRQALGTLNVAANALARSEVDRAALRRF